MVFEKLLRYQQIIFPISKIVIPMTTLNLLRASVACLLMIVGSMSLIAQDAATTPASSGGYVATPPDMWEVGIHAGPMLGFTDIQFTPSIGGGFHVRRA
ncbi:MAG: hypothetical protein D6818_03090, partial [Bacteroidetes bacterium]